MAFTESLTVRILGDSSQLKAELQGVVQDLSRLRDALDQATGFGDHVRDGFGQAAGAVRPLEQVSQLLGRLMAQAGQLSQTVITLNVQPAMQSLGELSRAIQGVAAQLAALAGLPIGGGAPAGAGAPGVRGFAGGGLVTGPSGRDVVPSLLTAGEYVLSREATNVLGTEFLDRLNSLGATRGPQRALPETATRIRQTTNHFGGFTIHVGNASDVNDIVRDLRLHGVQERNRRG